jgi:hypothetical protein
MESELFTKWVFGSGWFHNGTKSGQPKRAHVEPNGIAVLTTRFPGEPENERKIVGLYKITKITNNQKEETRLYADKKLRIRLPMEEARELYFWDYHKINAKTPLWGTGLLRYLEDYQIKNILQDLKSSVKSNQHREIISEMLDDYSNVKSLNQIGLRKNLIEREKRLALKRKYGAGGEGENHKKLKQYIANNPNVINIFDMKKCYVEYSFCCGDTVDILFERKNGQDVTVEIETEFPDIGSHQAIKYRVLRCAERGHLIADKKVQSVLVAWKIPEDLKCFCNKYDIKTFEVKK